MKVKLTHEEGQLKESDKKVYNAFLMPYNKNKDITIETAFKKSGMKNVGVLYTENLIHNTLNAELPVIKGNNKENDYFKLNYLS